MNEDLLELLNCLKSQGVEFLIIGAHAVGFHGRPRMTQDLDIWIGRKPENVDRLRLALDEFGAPIGEEGARRFCTAERQMVRIGAPPNMVDLLNFAGDGKFDEMHAHRIEGILGGIELPFPSVEDLIILKQQAGRSQDLADVESLKRHRKG